MRSWVYLGPRSSIDRGWPPLCGHSWSGAIRTGVRGLVRWLAISALLGPLGRIFVLSLLATLYMAGVHAGILSETVAGDIAIAILPLLVVYWAYTDSQRTRYWPAYHHGLWLYAAWPVLLPHYLVHTRGLRAWRLLLPLYLALMAPVVGGAIGDSFSPGVERQIWLE